jgi:hypothetical protein
MWANQLNISQTLTRMATMIRGMKNSCMMNPAPGGCTGGRRSSPGGEVGPAGAVGVSGESGEPGEPGDGSDMSDP